MCTDIQTIGIQGGLSERVSAFAKLPSCKNLGVIGSIF